MAAQRALRDFAWRTDELRSDRAGTPSARLVVDANQAWTVDLLRELAPALADLRVDLLEQPVPLARLCEIADLNGPLLQAQDWPDGITWRDGVMEPPSPTLWG